MITKDNYIEYIVDYFDGNLSPAAKQELFTFLGKHPEFYDDFLEYGDSISTTVKIENIDFNKTNLIKTDNEEFEKLCIDYIEGKVTETQIKKIAGNNELKKKTLELYKKTKTDVSNIIYPNKNKLIKRSITPIYYAAAAIIILMIAIPYLLKTPEIQHQYKPRTDYFSKLNTYSEEKATKKKINSIPAVKQTKKKQVSMHNNVKADKIKIEQPEQPLQKIKQNTINKVPANRQVLPDKLIAQRNIPERNIEFFKLENEKLKNFDFIGKNLLRNNKLKVKIKDNRLSFLAFNTKQFYLKVH